MPVLSITTNRALPDDRRTESLAQLSRHVAALLGKPERYVMISYSHNPHMLFAGTDDPLAYLELKSIGLPHERTAEFSAALCREISALLAVSSDRIYIEFSDAERHLFGWNGGTF